MGGRQEHRNVTDEQCRILVVGAVRRVRVNDQLAFGRFCCKMNEFTV
jgi:hypothetical protein